MGSSFKDAIDFARRTLSRSVDDDQPVATLYIAAIRNYLLRYSHDGKEAPVFIYDAVEQTGACAWTALLWFVS